VALRKGESYYKAIRRVVATVNSDATLEDKLDTIVRGITRSMKVGTSILLLDSSGRKLIHSYPRGLPQFFLKKGVLDAEKSLTEVIERQPVIITDVGRDHRVQYPEIAAKAGINSILGIPVVAEGQVVGSLRIYSKERNEFSHQDINFVTAMANLTALALRGDGLPQDKSLQSVTNQTSMKKVPSHKALSTTFAHPSEEDFARILDFYNIDWVYEPRSFQLRWKGERVIEMFTPDFYLPDLNIYIELTTLKQKSTTEKNSKLRRLHELYPEVNITLLNKKDYDHLLSKYGVGPLAQARAHSITQVLYSAYEIDERVCAMAKQITKDYAGRHPILIGVQRGFLCFMADLIRKIGIPIDLDFMAISYYGTGNDSAVKITKDMDLDVSNRHVLMIEDIVDTGITLNYILNHLRAKKPASLAVCTLLDRRVQRIIDVHLAYVGFEVPNEFVVGYGLDYREEYRNLPFIGIPVIGKKLRNKISSRFAKTSVKNRP
jgi:bifunctional protein TilS/HprT